MDRINFAWLWPVLAHKAEKLGDSLGVALLVFIGLLAAGRILAALLRRAARRQPRHAALLTIFSRAVWAGAVIVGSLSALQNLGVDVSAFVASLGLAGLTLGFALRDVVTSFVAGVLLIIYKPFRPGDHILVQGVEGQVLAIDLRYTTLMGDGRLHLVPNSIILTNPVSIIAQTTEKPEETGKKEAPSK